MSLPTAMRFVTLERPTNMTLRAHWSCKHGLVQKQSGLQYLDPLIGIQLSMDVFTQQDYLVREYGSRITKPRVKFQACDYKGEQLGFSGKILCVKHQRKASIDTGSGRHLCLELRINVHGAKVNQEPRIYPEAYYHSDEVVKEFRGVDPGDLEIPVRRLTASPMVFDEFYSLATCPGCKFHAKRSAYELAKYANLKNLDR